MKYYHPNTIGLRHWKEDGYCCGEVSVGGGEITTKTKVMLSEKDCERMATIISLEKMLRLAAGSRVIPPPARAALSLVHRLVALKHRAMLGEKGGKANLAKTLAAAKQSPLRSVRAVAAGLEEFLK